MPTPLTPEAHRYAAQFAGYKRGFQTAAGGSEAESSFGKLMEELGKANTVEELLQHPTIAAGITPQTRFADAIVEYVLAACDMVGAEYPALKSVDMKEFDVNAIAKWHEDSRNQLITIRDRLAGNRQKAATGKFDQIEITPEARAEAQNVTSGMGPVADFEMAELPAEYEKFLQSVLPLLEQARTMQELAETVSFMVTGHDRPPLSAEAMTYEYMGNMARALGHPAPPIENIDIEQVDKAAGKMVLRQKYRALLARLHGTLTPNECHLDMQTPSPSEMATDLPVAASLEDSLMINALLPHVQKYEKHLTHELGICQKALAATKPKTAVDAKSLTEKPVAGFIRGRSSDDDFGNRPIDKDGADPDPS